jgi:hypothetical protein
LQGGDYMADILTEKGHEIVSDPELFGPSQMKMY